MAKYDDDLDDEEMHRWCYRKPDGTHYVLLAMSRAKAEANRRAAEADGCVFVSESPHPEEIQGRFAHQCGSMYCRCSQ